MLVKCHEHLHPSMISFVDKDDFDHDCNLDIFQQTTSTSEPTKEIVKRELLIFRHYQVDVKHIKCHLQGWEKHETMFSTIGFLAQEILANVGSHIETKIK